MNKTSTVPVVHLMMSVNTPPEILMFKTPKAQGLIIPRTILTIRPELLPLKRLLPSQLAMAPIMSE